MNYIFLGVLLIARAEGLDPILEENPRRSFPARRAIDGTRGRAFYVPEESDTFDIYEDGGQYDPYADTTDFSDIRSNVPGEPGIDYPSYMRIPQTSFQCQGDYRGYYADEEAGCQLFHVCDGNFLVSSFLCPIGSIFSQKLLTCDWWNKVDCTATRNYYKSNAASLVTEADDDEILRKAYEMTSLQTSHTGIVNTKDRGLQRTAQGINDLQTGPNHYGDYADDLPDVQYKYSSRYSSSNHRDREIDYSPMIAEENQQNPKIKVHTIGQDHRNDNHFNNNDIRPSYAPTVPTVTTTTRRFYSPTVPTTSARPMSRHRYDLEFESSDHLYSARGRSRGIADKTGDSTTESAKPTIDTTTVVVEVPPTLRDLVKKPKKTAQNTETHEVLTEKAEMVTQFSTIEFQSLFSGENHTFGVDGDEKVDGPVELPSTDITPPFFYYSNVDQHEAIGISKIEESGPSKSRGFIINIQGNETKQDYADNEVISISLSTEHPRLLIKMENPLVEADVIKKDDDNEIIEPSKLFLPPLVDPSGSNDSAGSNDPAAANATEILPAAAENPEDSSEAESAPKEDIVDKLDAHSSVSSSFDELDGDSSIGSSSFDELDSDSSVGSSSFDVNADADDPKIGQEGITEASDLQTTPTSIGDSESAGSRTRVVNVAATLNKGKEKAKGREAGSISALRSADQYPRPFSLKPRLADPIPSISPFPEARSESRLSENQGPKDEVLDQLAQTFERVAHRPEIPIIFDLPHVTRTIDFKTGRELGNHEETRFDGVGIGVTEKDESAIETEFVPSIGFSLNSAAEREEYAEAVLRGLFTDTPVTSIDIDKSTDNPDT